MLYCPGVLEKVAAGLTGFSTAVISAIIYLNWSYFMDQDCFVSLRDSIGEVILVFDFDFS